MALLNRALVQPATKAYRPPAAPQQRRIGSMGSTPSAWQGGTTSSSGDIEDPWEAQMRKVYDEASGPVPYQGDWKSAVAQAMQLGGRDYEGALRGFAGENVDKQIRSADNQLGSIGMRELALRGDVQAERGKMRTDADTRAVIDSQGIKQNALAVMQSMLSSASGVELDRLSKMIAAAGVGSSHYLDFQRLAIPLQEKMALEQERRRLEYGG